MFRSQYDDEVAVKMASGPLHNFMSR